MKQSKMYLFFFGKKVAVKQEDLSYAKDSPESTFSLMIEIYSAA